jgi:hypothetical protein
MTNQQAAPKVPEHSKRLAKLRNRICAVVADGQLGVALSQEDMLTIAWALAKVSDPLLFMAPPGLDLPTEASSDDDRWRYLPQRALLVPPHAGPDSIELAADATAFTTEGGAVYTAWLARLAVRVRNGECSPEYALLAASFAGERREAERLK